jgi:DeoR/GlpR family transcriptional regulator of sugar metabolism
MKIFLSHSGSQKSFVRELCSLLSPPISTWLDELDMRAGADIDERIVASIRDECDLFVLIVDSSSANSTWVAREIEVALERERSLGQTFVLPIVLDLAAWQEMPNADLKNRVFLPCYSFARKDIESLAKRLEEEVFSWLAAYFKKAKSKGERPATTMGKLAEGRRQAEYLSSTLMDVLMVHRVDNPLEVDALMTSLRARGLDELSNKASLYKLIDELSDLNVLKYVHYDIDQEIVYLNDESHTVKSTWSMQQKRLIAKCALSRLTSGLSIAIDGGSTTLELVRAMCKAIKERRLSGLRVFTNSVHHVSELLQTLASMEVKDQQGICDVFVPCGKARSVSYTINGAQAAGAPDIAESLTWPVGFERFDIAFVGASGVSARGNFASGRPFEVPFKREIVMRADRPIILADGSKFQVPHSTEFAWLHQNLEIITYYEDRFGVSIDNLERIIVENGYGSRIVRANAEVVVQRERRPS